MVEFISAVKSSLSCEESEASYQILLSRYVPGILLLFLQILVQSFVLCRQWYYFVLVRRRFEVIMDLAGWFQMGQTPAHQWDRLRRLTDSEVSVCFRDFSRLPRSFSWVFFSSGPYKHKLIQRLSKVSCHQYYSI